MVGAGRGGLDGDGDGAGDAVRLRHGIEIRRAVRSGYRSETRCAPEQRVVNDAGIPKVMVRIDDAHHGAGGKECSLASNGGSAVSSSGNHGRRARTNGRARMSGGVGPGASSTKVARMMEP